MGTDCTESNYLPRLLNPTIVSSVRVALESCLRAAL